MSLGSRFMRRGTGAVITRLYSTPREPLLFLYPQWYRHESTATGASATFPNNALSQSQLDQSLHSQTKPFIAPQAATEAPKFHQLKRRKEPVKAKQNQQKKGKAAKGIPIRYVGIDKQDEVKKEKERYPPSLLRFMAIPDSDTTRMIKRPPLVRRHFSETEKEKGTRLANMVRKLSVRRLKAETNDELALRSRKAYQAFVRSQSLTWEPDWRVVLADLSMHTPQYGEWLDTALTITLPQDAAKRILYGIDDNMWEIASRYACSAKIYGSFSPSKKFQKIQLSGAAVAISKCAADILQVAPEAEIQATGPNTDDAKLQREVWSPTELEGMQPSRDARTRFLKSSDVRPRQITSTKRVPEPLEWTKQSFLDYVTDLTSIDMPNHLHVYMYEKKKVHIESVINILRQIFYNPDYEMFLTRNAFNTALRFLVKTNHIADARLIFVHMESKKIPRDVETFNILLRGAAKNQDLHAFHFILHIMLKRQLNPNDKTWIIFLMLVDNLRIKLYAVDKMREKGLLRNKETIKGACEYLVADEMVASLDLSQNQDEFLKHMDSKYGSFWLTRSSGNRIIHELGARGLISQCVDFLYIMEDRKITADEVSINTILNHCKHTTNIRGALEVLRNIPQSSHFIPDEMTYHVLFQMAWRRRAYNLARVTWRYACLNGTTTNSMRNQVVTSLQNSISLPGSDLSPRQFFKTSAGLFITAVRNYQEHPSQVFQKKFKDIVGFEPFSEPPADEQAPAYYSDVSHASQSSNTAITDQQRNERHHDNVLDLSELASMVNLNDIDYQRLNDPNYRRQLFTTYHDFVNQDRNVFQWWEPARPLIEMLTEAWDLDQEWINAFDEEAPDNKIDWRLDRAISIPVTADINQRIVTMDWK